jgi:hypothetical protein
LAGDSEIKYFEVELSTLHNFVLLNNSIVIAGRKIYIYIYKEREREREREREKERERESGETHSAD